MQCGERGGGDEDHKRPSEILHSEQSRGWVDLPTHKSIHKSFYTHSLLFDFYFFHSFSGCFLVPSTSHPSCSACLSLTPHFSPALQLFLRTFPQGNSHAAPPTTKKATRASALREKHISSVRDWRPPLLFSRHPRHRFHSKSRRKVVLDID